MTSTRSPARAPLCLAGALAAFVTLSTGCGLVDKPPQHGLTFVVEGSAARAAYVTVDPPGEQMENAETTRDIGLPWKHTMQTGFGFANMTAAAGRGTVTCRIVVDGQVRQERTSPEGGEVSCDANIQD